MNAINARLQELDILEENILSTPRLDGFRRAMLHNIEVEREELNAQIELLDAEHTEWFNDADAFDACYERDCADEIL